MDLPNNFKCKNFFSYGLFEGFWNFHGFNYYSRATIEQFENFYKKSLLTSKKLVSNGGGGVWWLRVSGGRDSMTGVEGG